MNYYDSLTGKRHKKFNVKGTGSSGTEIFGGYIFEEYLQDIRGSKWAEKADLMRRSDPIVNMILSAVVLPLVSENWFIEKLEQSEEADFQKKLFDKVIFEDISESFTTLLGEILTCERVGYSLFEKVHGVSYLDGYGPYNTIKKLAFRSQKTIERWLIKDGTLNRVYQEAQGDVGKNVEMDARFLVLFSPRKEGDNFEGFTPLRPCYGPWLRKNVFLKLLAAGTEKYGIPTPILKVPELKTQSDEFENAIEVLEAYVSNQSQYLTFPEGWDLTTAPITYDPDKVRSVIDKDNVEMVNGFLASFLLLGQGGGGSYSLSDDLSSFFAKSLQFLADHICEVFQKKVMADVMRLNWPNRRLVVSLRCDNLKDEANKAFADTMVSLANAGIIVKDKELERFVREKYKYPAAQEKEAATQPAVFSFAEKKSQKLERDLAKDIDELSNALSNFFFGAITQMGADFSQQLSKEMKKSRNVYQATAKVDAPTTNNHWQIVEYLCSRYAVQAKRDVLKSAGKKLSETIQLSDDTFDRKFKEWERVIDMLFMRPTDANLRQQAKKLERELATIAQRERKGLLKGLTQKERDQIRARSQVLVETQADDVYKALNLTAQQNGELPESALVFEVTEAARKQAEGPLVLYGPDILASTTVNSSIKNQEFEKEMGVTAYRFVAEMDDRTSEICQALNGSIISINDPDIENYQPPLHHNCRSVLAPIFGPADITGFPTLSKKAQDSITLSECCGEESGNRYKMLFKNVTSVKV